MTVEERLHVLEEEAQMHGRRLGRIEMLIENIANSQAATQRTLNALVEANHTNAATVAGLAAKIDAFVDAVFHRGFNGKAENPMA